MNSTGGEVANTRTSWRQLANDVALISFPWRILGIDFKRNVTLLRLADGRLIIHSTAAFTKEDVARIRQFGTPARLVEATLMHDTFANEGHNAFPDLPYLAPEGFTEATEISIHPLSPAPSDWAGEIDVFRIDGVRSNEHALYHRNSRSLVVADLFFSFPSEIKGWPRFFVRRFMGLPRLFGISSLFRRLVLRDKEAFKRSLNALLALDFERVVGAHSEPIAKDAKRVVEQALGDAKLFS